MRLLKGQHILLRALEPTDIEALYTMENDDNLWWLGETTAPYSKTLLTDYLSHAAEDIYTAKQLRLAIARINNASHAIGFIDLYDFVPKYRRAGVGIALLEEARGNGFATEALELLKQYAFTTLQMHQLYSEVPMSNAASVQLFSHGGFVQCGVKKEWLLHNQTWEDVQLFQCICLVHK